MQVDSKPVLRIERRFVRGNNTRYRAVNISGAINPHRAFFLIFGISIITVLAINPMKIAGIMRLAIAWLKLGSHGFFSVHESFRVFFCRTSLISAALFGISVPVIVDSVSCAKILFVGARKKRYRFKRGFDD